MSTFDYIFSLMETIYYNRDNIKVISNFRRWLKDDGVLCIHLFNPAKLDPAPRAYSQYYKKYDDTTDRDEKHSLTYFDDFAHDAFWTTTEHGTQEYVQSFIMKDGKRDVKRLEFYIPSQQEMIKRIEDTGFKLVDVINYRKMSIEDFELFCFKRK